MRILMITDVYFPRINGVSTSIQTFRSELEKLGHEVWLMAPSYNIPYNDDARIIRVPSRGIPLDPEDRMMKLNNILVTLSTLRNLDFQMVHVHTPFVAHYGGKKIAKALDVPCIVTYHTLFEEYFHHYIPWLPKALLSLIARRFSVRQCNEVDGVISPSSMILDLLTKYGVTSKMTTLPTGIDSLAFKGGNGKRFKEAYAIPTGRKLLLNVSRVAFEKNISAIIEAYAELKRDRDDIHLVIAGEGPAKNHYIQMARRLGLVDNISFVGYLDRKTGLVDCYHAADLFVFASKTETQGLVLLEAMATGTPVVSVAEMGTKNVLKDGFGAKITDGTPKDFSAKIAQVIDNPELYEHLQRTAISYAAEWDSLLLAKKLEEYYNEIISSYELARSLPLNQI